MLLVAPLFGVHFLFTAIRPDTQNCAALQTYYFASYTVEGAQALLVATLYCYTNKEVNQNYSRKIISLNKSQSVGVCSTAN